MTATAQLVLKAKRERSILFRHPWIFSGAAARAEGAEDGAVVRVVDNAGQWLGLGFYAATSQIVCRMFEWDRSDADPAAEEYWLEKMTRALHLRQRTLAIGADLDCYRLIHAEGDFFPGLIADVYGELLVIQILIKGVEKLLPLLVRAFARLGFAHIYLKGKKSATLLEDLRTDSGWLAGGLTAPLVAREGGLDFQIDFVGGQKTGFFLDQRDNRQLLRSLAKDKRVLNMFSYTGGFSVYALAGGASTVVSVDTSAEALKGAEENVRLNFPDASHQTIKADCLDYLKNNSPAIFDLIVLDPPAFAKNARSVPNAARGYKQINLQALRMIVPGGLLFTFSCSQNVSRDLFRKIVFGAATDARRNVRVLRQLDQPPDHPFSIAHPEGEYLKGLVLQVE